MKSTTKRIYRHDPRPLADGACPHCFRSITINDSGRRHRHYDRDGFPCTGGGILIGDPILDYDAAEYLELVDKALQRRARAKNQPRNPCCAECGRPTPVKNDGTFKAHRAEADTYVGPHCPGSGQAA